ncbi:sulfurtransferase [Arthrobacter sp. Sa2BUA2]|uniref:Sulfurtransferase n=1 Tax=Arthrobacter pullicola TaxID=2762224 RepID=A0ABR8YJ66_9MICC|nr:rhodanese-like domain-containing protein [Arthrobacter pullicola]MBD8044260.1 sulfurtransferase [Arthrobacter pullicola]
MNGVLISAGELQELLAGNRPVRLLDVRWELGRTDGHSQYLAGHLPGAVFVDLDTELSAPPGPGGRHPLPVPEDFHTAARGWGINDGDLVVAYDAAGGAAAARAWWLLRHAAFPEVRLLDGGLPAWQEAGGRLAEGNEVPVPGTAVLSWGHLPVADMETAGELASSGVLIDARAPERFRGEHEPIDPRAGHIPGAVNIPAAGNLEANGRFADAGVLRSRFEAAGVDGTKPVAAYCGSGVYAAAAVAALAVAGFDAALYPGSWSEWSSTPGAPVATGAGDG